MCKKINLFLAAGLLSFLGAGSSALANQSPDGVKRQMEIEDLSGWQTVGSIKTTDDGSIISWVVSPQEGDGKLYIRKFPAKGKSGEKELAIERAGSASLDPQGKWLYCRIKPEFKVSRQEKIKKTKKDKMTPTSP